MNGELDRNFSTVRRFGSLRSTPSPCAPADRSSSSRSASGRSGCRCTPGTARTPAAAPSTSTRSRRRRPAASPGRLAARDVGEGEPAEEAGTFFQASAPPCPGFQWPWSSIAALPLASRPAELVAPLLGRRRQVAVLERLRIRSAAERTCPPSPARVVEVVRDCRLLHRRLATELDGQVIPVEGIRPPVLAADAIGAMPALLSLAMAARNSGHVPGAEATPTCLKRSLLYQKPTTPTL